MPGYSGTPLPQKLGIKPGLTVVTINPPNNYRRLLDSIPEGVTFSDRLRPDSTFARVFVRKCSELATPGQVTPGSLTQIGLTDTINGCYWFFWAPLFFCFFPLS